MLSEVWIKHGEESRFVIPGYNMHLQPREENQAGGVIIYIDLELQYQHHLLSLPTAEIINIVLPVSSNNSSFNINFYGIYRSCRYPFSFFEAELLNILRQPFNPVVIIGDINVCTLKNSTSSQRYNDLYSSFGFKNYVNVPTRDQSCLDHILIRNSKNLKFD